MSGMKSKTIRSVLSKKFNEFLSSIEDQTLRDLVAKNSIITGGSIASMLLGEEVNDYDVYFRSRSVALAVANHYVAKFQPGARNGIPCAIYVDDTSPDRVKIVVKSAGVASETETSVDYRYFESCPEDQAGTFVGAVMRNPGEIEDANEELQDKAFATEDEPGKPPYRPVFMSTNAITLSNRIQLVLRFYGEPDEIHENYDFVHCTNYWKSWDGELVLHQPALEALLARELRYVGSKYPVCSVIRLRKFIKRGWKVNAGQILKMCMQISALNLTDPEVLQDQLTGVDAAYFINVMEKLREKDPEKVNSAYLVEIIDRML
jgi:hypothetical protein